MDAGLYAILFGSQAFGCYMLVDTSKLPDRLVEAVYGKARALGMLPGDPTWQALQLPYSGAMVGLRIESWDGPPLSD